MNDFKIIRFHLNVYQQQATMAGKFAVNFVFR